MGLDDPVGSVLRARRTPPVIHVDRDTPVRDASMLMRDARCSAVVLPMGEDGWGLLSERDIVRGVVARGLDADDTPVGWLVWDPAPTVQARVRIGTALRTLQRVEKEHVVVLDGERVTGVLAAGELAAHLASTMRPEPPRILRLVPRGSGN